MDAFTEEELRAIVAEGSFGRNVTFVSFERNTDVVAKDQFQSKVIFGTVTTSDGSRHPVVIKSKLRETAERDARMDDVNFHNENTVYDKIIPFLLECRGPTKDAYVMPTLPRFFYGRNRHGPRKETDLIIVEDCTAKGYRLSEERVFLDYNHLVNALQAIAKFHALSYTAKHENLAGFREIVANVRDTQWTDDGEWFPGKVSGFSLYDFGKRAVDRLLERNGHRRRRRDDEHLRRFVELIKDESVSLRRALRPREPLSVLCHGDFNRNNLLFRYDDSGAAADALLFDFGSPRYGSPALDLSFFLYMNASQQMRQRRWDDLLDAYCATLAVAVAPGVRAPGRAELDAEMRASALFGLVHALFFLPYQYENHASDAGPEKPLLLMGGETGTEFVADAVQHFVDMAFTCTSAADSAGAQ